MVARVQGTDKSVDILAYAGGIMGDGNAPDDFMRNFQKPVGEWRKRLLEANRPFYTKDPIANRTQDLGVTTYVDDILDFQIREATAQKLAQDLNKCNNTFDEELEKVGYQQNRSKQETTPQRANHLENRRCYKLQNCGRILQEIKHLGGFLDPKGSNSTERNRRVRALKTGWSQFRGLWFQRILYGVRRSAYLCKVQAAAVSAMETYVLTDSDCKALDTPVTGQLRAMLVGWAGGRQADHTHKAWSNVQVWQHWRLCPTKLELRVRRLRWMQSMSSIVLAALSGHCNFEKDKGLPATLGEQGFLRTNANPFAQMLVVDVNYMCKFSSADEFASAWSGSVIELFTDEFVSHLFVKLDPAALRMAFWAKQIAPGECEKLLQVDVQDELEADFYFVCKEKDKDGNECNSAFPTFLAMATRKRFMHQQRKLEHFCTLTNQLPDLLNSFQVKNCCTTSRGEFSSQAQMPCRSNTC